MNTYYYTAKECYDKVYKTSLFSEFKKASKVHPTWLIYYFYATMIISLIFIVISIWSIFSPVKYFGICFLIMFFNAIVFYILTSISISKPKFIKFSKKRRMKKIKAFDKYLNKHNFENESIIMIIQHINEYIKISDDNQSKITTNLYRWLFLPFSGLIGFLFSGYFVDVNIYGENPILVLVFISLVFLAIWFISTAWYKLFQDLSYSSQRNVKLALETILIYRKGTTI